MREAEPARHGNTVPLFQVSAPGLLSTVQDLGRQGWQYGGVPEAGAVDPVALRLGNLLLNNLPGEAALEVTLLGPSLEILQDTALVVAGADLGARLNGRPLPMWQVLAVRPGDRLEFAAPRRGCRAYICVRGGIAAPPVLGSRSTDLLSGLGGRALAAGDVLAGIPAGDAARLVIGRSLPPIYWPDFDRAAPVRLVLGPQLESFTREAVLTLLSSSYTLSARADRTGCRLAGPALEQRGAADIISDGTALGSVQVPQDGQPVILLQNRQTTGGYAKIATVISTDVPAVAQISPGGRLHFRAVSLSEAHRILAARRRWLAEAAAAIQEGSSAVAVAFPAGPGDPAPAPAPAPDAAGVAPLRRFKVTMGGRDWDVTMQQV